MTRIRCNQIAPVIADLEANFETCAAAIRDSMEEGARLIVLPELATSGYMLASLQEARSVAIRPDHSVFQDWAQLVAGVDGIVVAGFAELGDNDRVYNSAVVLGREGVLAVYRKTHLWDREKLIFTPGDAVPPVVDTPVGRLGILVCYDLEFPEMTRGLAVRGAEAIVVPTNWPREEVPAGEHVSEVVIAMAAARVNRVAIICCDRRGMERGQEWNEGTCIISEEGWVIAGVDARQTASAELDLAASHDKRISPRNDVLADRRPGLYGAVVQDGRGNPAA